jgi:hypothetical protein
MNRDPSPPETNQPEPREDDPTGLGGRPPARSATGREPVADTLGTVAASAFLYSTMTGFFLDVEAPRYKTLRDRLIADCGSPDDPIEVMLIEQLMLAHFNTGRLHYRAANATQLDEARAYAGAAVSLASEFRRGALALKAYREPSRSSEVENLPRVVADDDPAFPAKRAVGRRTGT